MKKSVFIMLALAVIWSIVSMWLSEALFGAAYHLSFVVFFGVGLAVLAFLFTKKIRRDDIKRANRLGQYWLDLMKRT